MSERVIKLQILVKLTRWVRQYLMIPIEIKMHLLEINSGHNHVDKAGSTPHPLPHKALWGWKGGGQKSPS